MTLWVVWLERHKNSTLCYTEKEIILFGIETTEEKFICDVDVRINPKIEALAEKYGQLY